jgi:hypothetical protein
MVTLVSALAAHVAADEPFRLQVVPPWRRSVRRPLERLGGERRRWRQARPAATGREARRRSKERLVLAGVDRHPEGLGGAGDEALVGARPVQVRPPDRARAEVGPVDAAGVDRHALGGGGAGDEALVGARAIQARPIVPVLKPRRPPAREGRSAGPVRFDQTGPLPLGSASRPSVSPALRLAPNA